MKIQTLCLITTSAALGLAACASGPQKIDFPADTNVQAKLGELRDRIKIDQTKQYDKLSPESFDQAGKSLSQAQHEADQNEPSEKVLADAGKSAAWLQLVEANASKHTDELAPVLRARQAAIDAHAQQAMPEEFAYADKDFNGFGREIENENFHPQAKEISKLEARYSDVELKAVKKTTLGQADAIIGHAESQGARSKAPLTFAAAQVSYDSALRSVEASRRNPTAYQGAVNDSMQSSHKLEQVMNTIGSSSTSETAAVKIYDQQQQLVSTRQSLNQAQSDTQMAQGRAMQEQQTAAALKGENDEYANKAANNGKIETAKAEFSPEEADVLRDGKKIILRLKMMKFSSARFELTQSSLQTLQKVKDMIAAVPFSKVVIEGHTDNVGGEKKNLALSQNRAETVKKYLVAEASVPEDKIEARGFGYEKPLTSNKTTEGRAINRRVDVVIDTAADL